MNKDYNLTLEIHTDVLKWTLENSKNIEKITARMLLKIMDIKISEPDRWREMANIKFGV